MKRWWMLAGAYAWAMGGCASTQPCPPVGPVPAPQPCEVRPTQVSAQPAKEAPGLSSWNPGPTREAIEAFVERVTLQGGPDFVPVEQRIAVFDNDGTLWSEQPLYVQLAFGLDRVKALSAEHPEWKKTQPFKAALEGDMKTLAASGTEGLLKLVLATHTGMTSDEFANTVRDWLASATHPTYGRPYTELTYLPMLELLTYLRAHGFKTFIVSGGGAEFMRPWTEAAYGIPPEQVVGSRFKLTFEQTPDGPVLRRKGELDFIDDGPGKPVGIEQQIGRRPIFAAGNSDGDLQMLQWSAAGTGPSLQLLVHHTDAEREVAYDKDSAVGRLDKALGEAEAQRWVVVDMAADWAEVFSTASKPMD